MSDLVVGTSLRSGVDSAEVIVVRAPSQPLDLRYAGLPLVGPGETAEGSVAPGQPGGPGTLIGKRYVHEASGLELLCVRPGPGSLSVNGEVLPVKNAKPLPASD